MGEYSHTIDAKGRVILPADFRAELGVSFIITKGLDHCLFLYAQAEWEALAAKLRQLPLVRPEARALARFFFSSARSLECDKQGRFLVPANLRSYAASRSSRRSCSRARTAASRSGARSSGVPIATR